MKETKAWIVYPPEGKGETRIRVVVDPKMPKEPDQTWLEAQLVVGLGFSPDAIEQPRLIWSDPDAEHS